MSVLCWSTLFVVLLASASTWHRGRSAEAGRGFPVSNRDVSHGDIELRFERSRAEGQSVAVLSQKLKSLGVGAFSALFELGLHGKWPDSEFELGGEEEQRAVFDALCAFPAGTLRNQIGKLGPQLLTDEGRVYGLELLLEVGTAAQVDDALLVASWSTDTAEADINTRSVSRPVRVALAEFLLASFDREEELTRTKVSDGFTTAPLALTSTLIDTLAAQRGRRNFIALAELLRRRQEVDPYLLVVLSKSASEIVLPVPERVRSQVRSCLDTAKSDDLRALSMRLLGRLEDEESLTRFMGELESENAVLSDAALDALRSCTGRKYGRNPRSWQGWLRAEEKWWNERASDIFAEVCGGKGGTITRSIQAIAHRRLHRHELAKRVECVLQREEHTLVILGCATLGHLESWNSLPALIHLMEQSDQEDVVRAAHKALMEITGLSPPLEPAAWQLLLERDR